MSNSEISGILSDRLKVRVIDREFKTVVNKISVEMIGENEESIIVLEHWIGGNSYDAWGGRM